MNMIQKRRKMKGQSGFTLIELLVAVAILGVLAGVAVFAVGGLTTDSKVQACKTERDTLLTAIAAAQASTAADTPTTFASNRKFFQADVAGSDDDLGKYSILRKTPVADPASSDCADIPFT